MADRVWKGVLPRLLNTLTKFCKISIWIRALFLREKVVTEENGMEKIMGNTKLASPGHSLTPCNALKIQNGHQGTPKWPTESTLRLLATPNNFC